LWGLFAVKTHIVTFYENCVGNLVLGLRLRVLARVPSPTGDGLTVLRGLAKVFVTRIPSVAPWSVEQVLAHYHGFRRTRYENAFNMYSVWGVSKRDARVEPFVKNEATPVLSDKVAVPRIIQPRASYVYSAILATFIKPVEQAIYAQTHFGSAGVAATRIFAKGLTHCQRAKLLQDKMSQFDSPVVVVLDCKRFDLHVSREQLEIEHWVYTRVCNDPQFRTLLSWQLRNVGHARSLGVYYKREGGRMSGDQNTSLGNSLLMVLMVVAVMILLGIVKYDNENDGDDNMIILEERDLDTFLRKVTEIFLSFGHEIKVEKIARTMEEVQWCQCRPVKIGEARYKFVRSPMKVLSKGLSGTKYFNNPDAMTRRKLIHSIGRCELVLNLGVPVLQEYALMCIRISGTTEMISYDNVDDYYFKVRLELRALGCKLEQVEALPISYESRSSFAKAFGISVELQLIIEERLRNLNPPILGRVDAIQEVDFAARELYFGSGLSIYPLWV
jgi:hypothetical protein